MCVDEEHDLVLIKEHFPFLSSQHAKEAGFLEIRDFY
jgi:hypothetical protein